MYFTLNPVTCLPLATIPAGASVKMSAGTTATGADWPRKSRRDDTRRPYWEAVISHRMPGPRVPMPTMEIPTIHFRSTRPRGRRLSRRVVPDHSTSGTTISSRIQSSGIWTTAARESRRCSYRMFSSVEISSQLRISIAPEHLGTTALSTAIETNGRSKRGRFIWLDGNQFSGNFSIAVNVGPSILINHNGSQCPDFGTGRSESGFHGYE